MASQRLHYPAEWCFCTEESIAKSQDVCMCSKCGAFHHIGCAELPEYIDTIEDSYVSYNCTTCDLEEKKKFAASS